MSVTTDAIRLANERVASATGRYAVAHNPRVSLDPAAVESRGSELAAAVIARSIITQQAKRSKLTLPQRVELINLLMPTDSTDVDHVLHELACESRGISTDIP